MTLVEELRLHREDLAIAIEDAEQALRLNAFPAPKILADIALWRQEIEVLDQEMRLLMQ